jgi:hypothetical protein
LTERSTRQCGPNEFAAGITKQFRIHKFFSVPDRIPCSRTDDSVLQYTVLWKNPKHTSK